MPLSQAQTKVRKISGVIYLTVRSLDPTGRGRIKWAARWKPALNAFAITSADRWPTSANQ